MFDAHVHLREPGRNDKETIRTGPEAAINGGVTGLVAMPNTSPAIDSGGAGAFSSRYCGSHARIPVQVAGAITKGREGKEMASIAGMVGAGVRMITDDGSPVRNPQMLRRAMEYAREFGLFDRLPLRDDGAIRKWRDERGQGFLQAGHPGDPGDQ